MSTTTAWRPTACAATFASPRWPASPDQGGEHLVGGALSRLIGAVGGREGVGRRRFAGEEQTAVDRLGENRAVPRVARQGMRVGATRPGIGRPGRGRDGPQARAP